MKINIKILPATVLAISFSLFSCDRQTVNETVGAEGEEVEQAEAAQQPMEPWMEQNPYTNVPAPVQQSVSAVLTNYLAVKEALVEANPEKVASAAREMGEAVTKAQAFELPADQQQFLLAHGQEVRQQAKILIAANDIEVQRAGLHDLTQHVYALAKGFGGIPSDLYLQYCPMARNNEGGYWLSSNIGIRNPYFGEKMLKCGETRMKL